MEFIRKTPEEVIKEITNTITPLCVTYNPIINAMVYTVSCHIKGIDEFDYKYQGRLDRPGNTILPLQEERHIYTVCLNALIRQIVSAYIDPEYKETFSRGVYSKSS